MAMLKCPALPTLRPKLNSRRAAQQRSNFKPFTFIFPSEIHFTAAERRRPIFLLPDISLGACSLPARAGKNPGSSPAQCQAAQYNALRPPESQEMSRDQLHALSLRRGK